MVDRVGQQLGNYRLVRVLGQGGQASVYLGEHVYLENLAAIKVPHAPLVGKHQANFLMEARRLSGLKHPHIVRLLDFGVEVEVPFLVMEYAPNGSLRTRHPKGSQVPLEMLLSYVSQIADALHYIHQQKLAHRDVKPENMLLVANQEVLLSDLGIAALAHATGSLITQEQAGTPPYMAPEQIQGFPREASDQYALGVVVYEWLCGACPFHGSALSILNQHLHTPPPALRERLPTISPDVEAVVLKALAKDPKERFASIQAFAAALVQAVQRASTQPIPLLTETPPLSQSQPSIHMVLPSSAPIHSSLARSEATSSRRSQSPTHRISRRAIVGGLAGLAGASAVGGTITWLANTRTKDVTPPSNPSNTVNPSNTALNLYVADGTLLSKLDAKTRVIHWSYKIGEDINQDSIYSTPLVVNGVVYFGVRNNSLYALNASTGSLRWRFKTNSSAALGSPIVVSGIVYFGATDGCVYTVNAADGSLRKCYQVGVNNGSFPPSVSLAQGVIYVTTFDNTRPATSLLALNANSGSQLWRNSTSLEGKAALNLQVVNSVVYLLSTPFANGTVGTTNYIYAFNTKDGSMLWRSDSISDFVKGPPTEADGAVYFGSQNGYMYALDAGTGKTLWSLNAGGAVYPMPIVVDGIVYITAEVFGGFSGDGFIIALNTNGSEHWRHALKNLDVWTQPVVSNGVIYIGLFGDVLQALRAADGSELWQYRLSGNFDVPLVTVAQ